MYPLILPNTYVRHVYPSTCPVSSTCVCLTIFPFHFTVMINSLGNKVLKPATAVFQYLMIMFGPGAGPAMIGVS